MSRHAEAFIPTATQIFESPLELKTRHNNRSFMCAPALFECFPENFLHSFTAMYRPDIINSCQVVNDSH